jgi:hypothetical protein
MDRDVIIDPSTSRLVRTWLHETADELPDDPALFAGIKATLRTPRSRRWTWPVRPGTLRAIKASLVATLAIVIAGLAIMPSPGGRAPAVGAAPSTSPPPSESPLPLPEGSIPPGRYSFPLDAAPLVERYDVSLDVPAGWSNDNGGWVLTKGGDAPAGATVEVDVIERIMVDPCRSRDVTVDVPPGSSLESFAAILSSWGSETDGRTSTSPTTTEPMFGTFDGRPGVELTVLTPADVVEASCTDGHYTLWGDEGGGRYIQGPSESFRVRAIQVGSELLFLAAGSFPGTPADVLAEQQAMLDSVRIVSRPAPSFAPASLTPATSLKTLPNISTDEAPGRYRVSRRWHGLGDGSAVSVELLSGWRTVNSTIVDDTRGASLDLWAIDGVFADPCTHDRTINGPWPSLEGFAESVTAWTVPNSPANPVVSVPRFDDYDGYPGFEVTVAIPPDMDVSSCPDGEYQLWRWIDQDVRRAEPGDELLIRVIAVEPASADAASPSPDPRGPELLFVVASTRPGTPPEARKELLSMVDSVRIDRIQAAGPSGSPGAP